MLRKVLWWLLGAIFSGLLVNAIWELAARPVLFFLSEFAFNVGTLGLRTLRDAAFAQMALDHSERPALIILNVITGASLGFCVICTIIFFERSVPAMPSRQSRKPLSKRLRVAMLATMYILALVNFSSVLRTSYAITGAQRFEQMVRIIAPYVSSDEVLRLRSRFAQMTTEGEYDAIMAGLKHIAVINGLKMPRNI